MNECLAKWQTCHACEQDHEGSEPPVVGASSGQDKSRGEGPKSSVREPDWSLAGGNDLFKFLTLYPVSLCPQGCPKLSHEKAHLP